MQLFKKLMFALDFQAVSKNEIIQILLNNHLIMPERATPKNAMQQQFKHTHKSGYVIWIHTMIMEDDCSYSEKGMPWIHVINPQRKVVFSRAFQKDTLKNPTWLLGKLKAYARFLQIALNEKPRGYHLKEILNDIQWENRKGEVKKFLWNSYLLKLAVEDRLSAKRIARKENSMDRYLRRTQPFVDAGVMRRRRTIRSTWKTKQFK
jgi:hypothetical protein